MQHHIAGACSEGSSVRRCFPTSADSHNAAYLQTNSLHETRACTVCRLLIFLNLEVLGVYHETLGNPQPVPDDQVSAPQSNGASNDTYGGPPGGGYGAPPPMNAPNGAGGMYGGPPPAAGPPAGGMYGNGPPQQQGPPAGGGMYGNGNQQGPGGMYGGPPGGPQGNGGPGGMYGRPPHAAGGMGGPGPMYGGAPAGGEHMSSLIVHASLHQVIGSAVLTRILSKTITPCRSDSGGCGCGLLHNVAAVLGAGPQYGMGSGPVTQSNEPLRITPIRSLNPYINRWTIKARVSQKGEVRR